MDISIKNLENASLVAITGSIDALTAAEVTGALDELTGKGNKNLVIDLANVEFMSSAGLRAILGSLKSCRQLGGDLRLAAAQPGVAKILKMSGFTSILQSFETPETALASFK